MPENHREAEAFRFGPYELRVSTQELLCEGVACDLEPKAFSVLRYLIEHRDRVVTKDELLINVWNTPYLTDGVIARAITKLRRAIGDVESEPQYVKTAHRVGYRFVGALVPTPPQNLQVIGDSRSTVKHGTPAPRLALLPFANRTGAREHDWVELGLMTMVYRAIENAKASLVPIEEVIATASGFSETALTAERRFDLVRKLGTEYLLTANVRSNAERFSLRWSLHLPEGMSVGGEIDGPDLLRLATDLAELIVQKVSVGDTRAQRSGFADPFFEEAYAMGMQAYHEGRFGDAQELLDVCVTAQPHPISAEIDHFASLADAFDVRAVRIGEALLSDPDKSLAVGDKSRVLEKLAILYGYLDELDRAQMALNRCRDILADVETVEQEVRLLIVIGGIEWRNRRFRRASAAIDEALRLCNDDVPAILGNRASGILGWIALARVDAGAAALHFAAAAATAASRGWVAWQGLWLSGLAEAHLRAGEIDLAGAAIQEALPLIDQAGSQLARVRIATARWARGYLCGDAAGAASALSDLEQAARRGSARDRIGLALARAATALAEGDLEGARTFTTPIETTVLNSPQLLLQAPLLLAVHLRLGRFDDARQLIEKIRERCGKFDDPTIESLHASCTAHLQYAMGSYDSARATLDTVVQLNAGYRNSTAPGVCAALLDVIWMAAEEGRVTDAKRPVQESAAWLDQCLRALPVRARWQFANHEFDAALESHLQYTSAFPHDRSEFTVVTEKRYRQAVQERRPVELARAPFLPSLP
jgi:DNA-binding winged helix-turn-helix (wHTH) protein